jgi:cellobiose-specific phosphotransferase system component IIA
MTDDKKAEEVLSIMDKASEKQNEAVTAPNKTEKKKLEQEADELIQQAEEVLKDAQKSDAENTSG